MQHGIAWMQNTMRRTDDRYLQVMSLANVEAAYAFHRSFPMYRETPLASLSRLAGNLGVSEIHVKDESFRFGLNAFKVLGGSFAMAKYIAGMVGKDIAEVGYAYLTGDALRREFGQTTFFTATDGNHGRGVAWSARVLDQKAVIFMPAGTKKVRLENIRKEGAEATIEDANYDACVRIASEAAKAAGGVVVQDTAWEGYEEIPSWIMQGYGTMAREAARQLGKRPTHIFLQAGVGSMAAAVQGYFANLYPEDPPAVVVVEADEAACFYRSAMAGDGAPRAVGGDLATMMAGLACGEVNPIAFDILKNHAEFYAACPDWTAAMGMRMLGAPVPGDPRVISGESGAVGLGLLRAILEQETLRDFRAALGLSKDSVVLLFSTEGDTDPENYRRICWDGAVSLNSRCY